MFLPPDVQMLKLSNRLIAKLLQLVLKGFIYLFLWHPELPPPAPPPAPPSSPSYLISFPLDFIGRNRAS